MIVLPLTVADAGDHFTFDIELDGTTYGLEFRWNDTEQIWHMTVLDATGGIIYAGISVVVDFPLGKRCVDSRFPPGVFMAQDTTGKRENPGRDDLGTRVQILYMGING